MLDNFIGTLAFVILCLLFVLPMSIDCWKTEQRIKAKKKWLDENKDNENRDWKNSPFCS